MQSKGFDTQIISLNRQSKFTLAEKKAYTAYKKRHGKCPYCEIIKKEIKGARKVHSGKISVFAPFASKWPFELLFFPKKHRANLSELDSRETREFAVSLKKALTALGKLNAPYNFYIHQAAKGTHMHLRLSPRLSTRGGFEEQTGTIINSVSPENAADFYRKNWK